MSNFKRTLTALAFLVLGCGAANAGCVGPFVTPFGIIPQQCTVNAPEIDATAGLNALGLLAGGMVLLRERAKKSKRH